MTLVMGYVCSCGEHWLTSEWEDVEAHVEANATHVVTEGYFKDGGSGVPNELPVRASGGEVYRLQMDDSGGVASEGSNGQATKMPKSRQAASTSPGVDDDASEGYEKGSRWVNATDGLEFVCTDSTTGAAKWRQTTNEFGVGNTEFTDPGPYSTTRSQWQLARRFTSDSLDSGTYRVEWEANLSSSTWAQAAYMQVQVDGETIGKGSVPASTEMKVSGSWEGDLSGEINFDFEHMASNSSSWTTSILSNLKLTFWRVS